MSCIRAKEARFGVVTPTDDWATTRKPFRVYDRN